MKLVFKFSEEEFVQKCKDYMQRSGTTIYEDIYHSLCFFLDRPHGLGERITKVKHKHTYDYSDPSLSLLEQLEEGFIELYYPLVEYYSEKDDPLDITDLEFPDSIDIREIRYGGEKTEAIRVKQHDLKTMSKVSIRINHIKVMAPILRQIYDQAQVVPETLIPSRLGAYEWRQTFYNKVVGEPRFCSCFKYATQKERDNLAVQSHPHVLQALKDNHYEDEICHLCTQSNSDLFFCSTMYGSSFKVKYGAYIRKFEIEQSLDERQAENYVRDIKGVPRIGEMWINETLLFNYVDALFPDFEVLREASPFWLDRQRLDIFIPKLSLAIEYQGQQHFKAVAFFGGEEALEKNKVRDSVKASKCRENGVELIYFSYKDELSDKLVATRLHKYLISQRY